jgi:hypothetical protein
MMSDVGRELNYRHWDKGDLVRALMQAEDDLKEQRQFNLSLREERDQYYRESRDSAVQLGKIIAVLRDQDPSDVVPLVTGRHPRSRYRVTPEPAHRFSHEDGISAVCACGAQWLVQAGRCVTQPVKP